MEARYGEEILLAARGRRRKSPRAERSRGSREVAHELEGREIKREERRNHCARSWLAEAVEAGRTDQRRKLLDRPEVQRRQQPLPDEPAIRDGRGDNRWGTYNQIREAGGQVRKGEKGTQVLFFTDRNSRVAKDEKGQTMKNKEGKTIYEEQKRETPICKQYTVFNVEQAEGLELKPREGQVRPEWDAHRDAEKVIAASGPTVEHVAGDRAYYRMAEDKVVLPEPGQFPTRNGYYQTALHECGHATGHPDRMNRETLKEGLANGFGSPEYAREELRAEISAMMTGERVGVGHDPQRGAAYVENWVKVLEKDPHEIHRAARDAQKMTDHLMERAINREVEKPSEEKSRAELTQEYSHARGPQISQTPKQSPEQSPERHYGPQQSPEKSPQKQTAQVRQPDQGPSR